MFGDKNPLDEIICFYSIYGEPRNLRISGVFKEREQSILACDAITSFEDSYGGYHTIKDERKNRSGTLPEQTK
ncbi:MAG: hypothetical protein LUH15_16500 [Tannerellaceae bacterium]|nr:hypothetical protein [Tannerellaceae bacterium]